DRSVIHAVRFDRGGIVDLGTLGGDRSEASFIADSGAVVGWSALADGRVHPFLFRDGSMVDLEPAGTSDGRAIGMDRAGRILGVHRDPGSGEDSSFLIEDGVVRGLGVPGAAAI